VTAYVGGPAGAPSPPTRNEAKLLAELRAAQERLDAIRRVLDASPIGPTRAEACMTLFEIRQLLDAEAVTR